MFLPLISTSDGLTGHPIVKRCLVFFVCVKVVRANKVAPICLLCESKKAQKVCKIGKYAYLCTHKSHRGVEQLVARRAHNPEAGGSSPPPATKTNGESFDPPFVFALFSSVTCARSPQRRMGAQTPHHTQTPPCSPPATPQGQWRGSGYRPPHSRPRG